MFYTLQQIQESFDTEDFRLHIRAAALNLWHISTLQPHEIANVIIPELRESFAMQALISNQFLVGNLHVYHTSAAAFFDAMMKDDFHKFICDAIKHYVELNRIHKTTRKVNL